MKVEEVEAQGFRDGKAETEDCQGEAGGRTGACQPSAENTPKVTKTVAGRNGVRAEEMPKSTGTFHNAVTQLAHKSLQGRVGTKTFPLGS